MENEKDFFLETKKKTEISKKKQTKEPNLYKVILLNDNYTTMDFVVDILVKVFNKEPKEATAIMLDVHNKGKGVCGVYTYDIAITKIKQVESLANSQQFPLRCSYEKA